MKTKTTLVHNKAEEQHDNFISIPIYTFKEALDSVRMMDSVSHREGVSQSAMGFLTRTSENEYKFNELGDLNNYKSVKF